MSNEIKTHHLKTIQDIYDVVDENNMDFFLEDFKMFLIECVKAKLFSKAALSVLGITQDETNGLTLEEFEWIEDGKHDNHGTIVGLKNENGKTISEINITELANQINIPENE